MKAFIFERNGEPSDVLAIQDRPDPMPGPGEVLVRVRLSPVHPTDLHVLRGRFGRQPALPASPGVECVGTVEALGPGVTAPAPGTRVVLLNVWGAWRELIVSPVGAGRSGSRRGVRRRCRAGHRQPGDGLGVDHGRTSPATRGRADADRGRVDCRAARPPARAFRGVPDRHHRAPPHGIGSTHRDQVSEDPLPFFKA